MLYRDLILHKKKQDVLCREFLLFGGIYFHCKLRRDRRRLEMGAYHMSDKHRECLNTFPHRYMIYLDWGNQ